jgi:hypothetical protein
MQSNALSLRKPATKPQFSRKRNRHCLGRERASTKET